MSLFSGGVLSAASAAEDAPGWSWTIGGGGVTYVSPHGTFLVKNGYIRGIHDAAGGGTGTYGYPVANEVAQGGTFWHQVFERGVIYSSYAGSWGVTGDINTLHRSLGGGTGALGYPTGAQTAQGLGDYAFQTFERGVIYSSPSGTYAVNTGSILTYHAAKGGGTGTWLGYPVSNAVTQAAQHTYQRFENGIVYTSPSGTFTVREGLIESAHRAAGGGGGPTYGYPIAEEVSLGNGNWSQKFERGTITVSTSSSRGATAVAFAMAQVGDSYRLGANGPDVWDCSSLVKRAWAEAGVTLPRVSRDQYAATTRISASQLQPGDLIFYSNNGTGSGVYHVAMWTGPGMRVHAANPSKGVVYETIYNDANIIGYGRVN